MERHFRDGRIETWWAADARLAGCGPDSPCRLIVATTDPARLSENATGYLATNLPHPRCIPRRHRPAPTGRAQKLQPFGYAWPLMPLMIGSACGSRANVCGRQAGWCVLPRHARVRGARRAATAADNRGTDVAC